MNSQMKRCIGQGMWEGARSSRTLSRESGFPNLHVLIHQKLLEPHPFGSFITEAELIESLAIGD